MIYDQNGDGARVAIDVDNTYRRYGPMVYRRCRSLLGNEAQAEDAMQDVFVKLLLQHRRLDDRALSSLLYRMATFVCLNRLRSKARRPETRDEALLLAIADSEDVESTSEARSVLGRLFRGERRKKPSTRVIATLHYVDGFTLEETAAEVGLSVSGVRKRLRTLRSQLRGLERLEDMP